MKILLLFLVLFFSSCATVTVDCKDPKWKTSCVCDREQLRCQREPRDGGRY